MINRKLIEKYKLEYAEATGGRSLGEDIYLSSPKALNHSLDYWADIIADYFQIDFEDLKRSNTNNNRVPKRWFYYICSINGINCRKIATFVGRERSSVSQAINKFYNLEYKRHDFKFIEAQIRNYKNL